MEKIKRSYLAIIYLMSSYTLSSFAMAPMDDFDLDPLPSLGGSAAPSMPTITPLPSLPAASTPQPSVAAPAPLQLNIASAPAPAPVAVFQASATTPAPAPVQTFQAPAPAPVPVFQAPAPALPAQTFQAPAPAPAPVPVQTFQAPAPAPVPVQTFQAPAPAPRYPVPTQVVAPVPGYPAPTQIVIPRYVQAAPGVQPVQQVVPVVNPRIAAIKAIIDSKKNNFSELTALCTEALGLLPSFPAEEQNTNNPNSFLSKLKSFIPYLYSQRANKSFDQINNLKTFFTQAQANTMLAAEIKKEWISTLNTLFLILMANNKKNPQLQAQDYKVVFSTITNEVDPFEVTLAANGIANLFVNRQQYDNITLLAIKDLLGLATNEQLKQKNIFAQPKLTLWMQWKDIIATNISLASLPEFPNQAITLLEQSLLKLSLQDAHHERRLFVSAISDIFNERGNMTQVTLKPFKNLLIKVRKQKKLLSNNQLKTLARWIQEIQFALSLASKPQFSYIEGLIARGISESNFNLIAKGANLFTAQTPKQVKNKLIKQLNNLLAEQEEIQDPAQIKELIRLLRFIRSKTIKDKGFLLNENQQKGIDEWIKRLKEKKLKKSDYSFSEESLNENKEEDE